LARAVAQVERAAADLLRQAGDATVLLGLGLKARGARGLDRIPTGASNWTEHAIVRIATVPIDPAPDSILIGASHNGGLTTGVNSVINGFVKAKRLYRTITGTLLFFPRLSNANAIGPLWRGGCRRQQEERRQGDDTASRPTHGIVPP